MKFNELVTPTLTDLFVKEITDKIFSGDLKIGQKLPNERELAEKMKVSRAVINGGLTQLAYQGFVEVVPRKGTFIADYKRKGSKETILAFLRYNGGRFDPETLRSAYELRDNEEAHIAKLAARRRTKEDIASLRRLIDELNQLDDPEQLADTTFDFYHTLSIATGNILYPMTIYSNRVVYLPLLQATYRQTPKKERISMMNHLIDLIEEQKEDESAAYINEISRWSQDMIKKNYTPGSNF